MPTPWRKLYVQIADNTFLMRDNIAFCVFTKLLLLANNKGEYAASSRDAAEFMNLHHSTYYRAVVRLEQQGIVEIVAMPRGKETIIRIVNWSTFQGSKGTMKQEKTQQTKQALTDRYTRHGKQYSKQLGGQRRNSGETAAKQSDPILQRSADPLRIRNKNKNIERKNIDEKKDQKNETENRADRQTVERVKRELIKRGIYRKSP